jgi:hypothetical protein
MEQKQNSLEQYVGRGRQVGQENAEKVAAWVYGWGWSTEPVIQALLGVKRRPCSDLVRRGVLEQVKPPAGHRTAYIVGSAWRARALDLFEDQNGMVIPYPYPRTAIPFSAYGDHAHQAQLIALNELKNGGRVVAERLLRTQIKKGAVPDFVLQKRGKEEWHEVELTPKYNERLFFQLQEREAARRAGRFSTLVWWCGKQGIARKLVATLSLKRIPNVIRRGDGRIVCEPYREGWNPAQLLAASEILLVDGVRRVKVKPTFSIEKLKLAPADSAAALSAADL